LLILKLKTHLQLSSAYNQGWGAGAGARAILFFLQETRHFKKLEWSRNWSRSWRKL